MRLRPVVQPGRKIWVAILPQHLILKEIFHATNEVVHIAVLVQRPDNRGAASRWIAPYMYVVEVSNQTTESIPDCDFSKTHERKCINAISCVSCNKSAAVFATA